MFSTTAACGGAGRSGGDGAGVMYAGATGGGDRRQRHRLRCFDPRGGGRRLAPPVGRLGDRRSLLRRRGRHITGCRVRRRLGGRGNGRRGGRRDGLRFGRRPSSRESAPAAARFRCPRRRNRRGRWHAPFRSPPRPPGSAAPAPRVRARDAPRRAGADRRRAPPLRRAGQRTGAAVRVRGAALDSRSIGVAIGDRRRGDASARSDATGWTAGRERRRRRHEELVGHAIVFRDPAAPNLGPDVVAAARRDDREVLAWELRHRRQLVLDGAELVERVLQLDRQQLATRCR